MKYIDAEKLIAEINKISPHSKSSVEGILNLVYGIITSLQQEQSEVDLDLEKVWNWIDDTFRETEVNSRYGESRNVLMSGYDVLKSDLREKFERDFGLNARNEE